MKLINLIRETRSYRSFNEEKEVTREMLLEILEAAPLSSCGRNAQALKFLIVHDKEDVEKMLPLTGWAGALPERTFPPEGHHPRAFILICHDKKISQGDLILGMDVGIVAQNMALLIREKGLGSLMIANIKRSKLKELFNLEEHLEPILALAIGEPDEVVRLVPYKGDTAYYRDGEDTHLVPKKNLEELLIK